jgi:uncharacterized repeat protein (TIGR03803 family)
VFELVSDKSKTKWTEKVLYSFCSQTNCSDGSGPVASLIMDRSGALYGTTDAGGAYGGGTAFALAFDKTRRKWGATVLYSFCLETGCTDGAGPQAALIIDRSGNLYGTTSKGGANCVSSGGCGTVFALAANTSRTAWTETVLYSFCAETNCADGEGPLAGLIMDPSGRLYGTTYFGGQCNGFGHCGGTVFELSPSETSVAWRETRISLPCWDQGCKYGANPDAGLFIDGSGNLYGTTAYGGIDACTRPLGCGTVFKWANVHHRLY